MARRSSGVILQQIQALLNAGRSAGSRTGSSWIGSSPAATRSRSWPSRSWSSGTGRWCWASAAASWSIRTTPRTRSRRRFSCWSARPARSGSRARSGAGSSAWPRGWRRGPGPMPGAGAVASDPGLDRLKIVARRGIDARDRAGRHPIDPGRGDRQAPRPAPGPRDPLRPRRVELRGGGPAARLAGRDGQEPALAGQGPPARAIDPPRPGPGRLAIAVPLAPADLPHSLIEATTRAAQSLIAGRLTTAGVVSASVATLTKECSGPCS